MKNSSLYVGLFLSALTLITTPGCSKDDDDDGRSRTELLTKSSWKNTAITVNPSIDFDEDGDLDSDILALIDACGKDNLTIFYSDGTGVIDEGPTKCDDLDDQQSPFVWALSPDGNTLVSSELGSYRIAELTSSKLVLTREEDILGTGTTNVITLTFTH